VDLRIKKKLTLRGYMYEERSCSYDLPKTEISCSSTMTEYTTSRVVRTRKARNAAYFAFRFSNRCPISVFNAAIS
jgi:hypothetical protein